MTKDEALEFTKKMLQAAGTDRTRALFAKYSMRGVTPNVTGIITGIQLYGMPFAEDFAALVRDAVAAKAGYTDYGIPEGPTSTAPNTTGSGGDAWYNSIIKNLGSWLTGGAALASALSGNPYIPQSITANGQPVYIPLQSQSNSNTALMVIAIVVVILIIALVALFAFKRK